ncbi:acyl carrier protein [Rhizobium leguminosarum]|uniref:acyl carrier protein n=1 Tax=Rhizobium leguminosarum TaxID=384 RepID=UPI001C91CA05|nr:acyl carrier protein [Rhizobium leguminosarum]MBY2919654.1 acyl carrier protein [Rhizobium leguminosarum]MBY2975289.1 acyl carrier protein [Rhizobium leguminosarum]MBY2982723.1 acyl carrier protein [Rhizobium leguminosarum]MBY3011270.1 acyl carrier protein [Rhizobium leguminosarum]
MKKTIRDLVAKFGKLPGSIDQVADDADLYAAGLTSFASVQLMLGIEEAFDIDFPDNLLDRKSFASISAIATTVDLVRDSGKVA